MDISYHYLFQTGVSDIGLETVESYLILRAVVLTDIYGICFATLPRAVVMVPRWVSGLHLL